jgi:hypothetical protein
VINEDGQWIHFVQACKDEYLTTYPGIDIEEQTLMAHIRKIVDRFEATRNVSKGKSQGRPQVREEVAEDLRLRMEQVLKFFIKIMCTILYTAEHLPENCKKEVAYETFYNIRSVQQLKPADYPGHVAYSASHE